MLFTVILLCTVCTIAMLRNGGFKVESGVLGVIEMYMKIFELKDNTAGKMKFRKYRRLYLTILDHN